MRNIQNKKEILKLMDVISSGYAGVLSNGNIVDRREFPNALPVQKNEMFNVPKPKKVEKEHSVD